MASCTTTRRVQPQRDHDTPQTGSSKPPVFSFCLQIDPGVLEATESRVGHERGEESRIEEVYDDEDGLGESTTTAFGGGGGLLLTLVIGML